MLFSRCPTIAVPLSLSLSLCSGNWNEDQYGCDLMSATASASPSFFSSGRLFSPLTTSHATFTTAGHDIIRDATYEEKTQPRMSPEVDKQLLFPHRGADPIDRRYQTSYLSSYCPTAAPAVDRTIRSVTNQEHGLNEGQRDTSRTRTYRTASSDAFNAQNSVLALRADEGAQQMRRGNGPARAGQLAKSLEQNYRNLRLRKD